MCDQALLLGDPLFDELDDFWRQLIVGDAFHVETLQRVVDSLDRQLVEFGHNLLPFDQAHGCNVFRAFQRLVGAGDLRDLAQEEAESDHQGVEVDDERQRSRVERVHRRGRCQFASLVGPIERESDLMRISDIPRTSSLLLVRTHTPRARQDSFREKSVGNCGELRFSLRLLEGELLEASQVFGKVDLEDIDLTKNIAVAVHEVENGVFAGSSREAELILGIDRGRWIAHRDTGRARVLQ